MQILAPLPIGFAVFLVHLATIPITGTGINPARSLGAAIIFNKDHAWDDHVSWSFQIITIYLIINIYIYISRIHFEITNLYLRWYTNRVIVFFVELAVDLLGWSLHWSCTCCCVPYSCHQGHSLQKQILNFNVKRVLWIVCV